MPPSVDDGFVRMFTVRVSEHTCLWTAPCTLRLHNGQLTAEDGAQSSKRMASSVAMRRLIACARLDAANDTISLRLMGPEVDSTMIYVQSAEVSVASSGAPRRQLFALLQALAGFGASDFYTHYESASAVPAQEAALPGGGWDRALRLYPDQVEALRWMQQVECDGATIALPSPVRVGDSAYLAFDGSNGMRLLPGPPPVQSIRPRGGVLHNAVGTGKTAVIVALAEAGRAADALPAVDSVRSVAPRRRTRATLVCVPSNLVGQWCHEIEKFTPGASVVTLVDIRHHRRLTSELVRNADFVITTYSFLRGKSYDMAILQAMRDCGYAQQLSSSRTIIPDLLSMFFADNAAGIDERGPTFLESWTFERIVLDEIHEIKGMSNMQRATLTYRMLTLSSASLWGVTATKPQTGHESNQILDVLAPEWRQNAGEMHNQFLVEAMYRAFGAGGNGVDYTSRVCLVQPTPTERAVIEAMPTLELRVIACTSLRGCVDGGDENTVVGSLTEILQRVLDENDEALRRAEAETATQTRVRAVLADALSARGDAHPRMSSVESIDRRLQALAQTITTLRLRGGFLRTVAEQSGPQECPVCFDAMTDSMMRCGHMYCYRCATRLQNRCAVCRETSAGLYRVGDPGDAPEGCKLQCVLQLLSDLHGRGESCVVFVQWSSVLSNTYEFLRAHTSTALFKLRGNAHARQATLRRFDECASGVLLLSLDCSSSGLNLVKANHVVFMHALTQPDALEIERQAIARVARVGQTRAVHVHHIIAENTTEQTIFDQERRQLRTTRFWDGGFVPQPVALA